jgi:hypothetical protein
VRSVAFWHNRKQQPQLKQQQTNDYNCKLKQHTLHVCVAGMRAGERALFASNATNSHKSGLI